MIESQDFDERINFYLKIVAANRLKAFIKAKFVKVFPEYDNEVDKYLSLGKLKWEEEEYGIWV